MGNALGNKQKAIMKAIVSNPSAMPAKIVNRFPALAGGCYATLFGHGGKRQKSTPIGNEAREQKCGRQRVGVRTPGGEAQRHSRIDEKVERDIKESAAISRPRCTRNCTIEPIGDPVCDQ
jgi:hypothetical protein